LGILQVNQIKERLKDLYSELIIDANEDAWLSKALAAYSIQLLYPHTSIEEAVIHITDDPNDNGLDLIYYHKNTNELCLVQSKFNKRGDKEPEYGEILKFSTGVSDLVDMQWNNFNEKVKSLKDEIVAALENYDTRLKIILVFTAERQRLAEPATRALSELLEKHQGASIELISQMRLHRSLRQNSTSRFIDHELAISNWGKYGDDFPAYYGQISAMQIKGLWEEYGDTLFEYNVRKMLGKTDVNAAITDTLNVEPEKFWYYNNGITITCGSIRKQPKYGNSREIGVFLVKGLSIVNGAQTVGTIGKFGMLSEDNTSFIADAYVPIKIIPIMQEDEDGNAYLDEKFAQDITTNTNRQNEIESSDFVAFDKVQRRIENELAISGVTYHLCRSENLKNDATNLTLEEATRALSYAKDIDATILVRREINYIYQDLNHTRYKKLFNPSVTSFFVWNCTNIYRRFTDAIKQIELTLPETNQVYAVYGHGLITRILFESLGTKNIKRHEIGCDQALDQIDDLNGMISQIVELIQENVQQYDKGIANVFKSPNNIRSIYQNVLSVLNLVDNTENASVEFLIEDLDNVTQSEKAKLQNFFDKIRNNQVALDFFQWWLTQIFDPIKHHFNYLSNIHFYQSYDGTDAANNFIFRIAYHTKMIIYFEHNNYGTIYKSVLFTDPIFTTWAEENLDEKHRIVLNQQSDIERIKSVKQFIR